MTLVYTLRAWLAVVGLSTIGGCGSLDVCDASTSDFSGTFHLDIYEPQHCRCGARNDEPGDCATACASFIAEHQATCNPEQTYCTYFEAANDGAVLSVDDAGQVTVQPIEGGKNRNGNLVCTLNNDSLCDFNLSCTSEGDRPLLVSWKRVDL